MPAPSWVTERPDEASNEEFAVRVEATEAAKAVAVVTEAKVTGTPAIVMVPVAGVPVKATVCCSPPSSPARVRVVVGFIRTSPSRLTEVA